MYIKLVRSIALPYLPYQGYSIKREWFNINGLNEPFVGHQTIHGEAGESHSSAPVPASLIIKVQTRAHWQLLLKQLCDSWFYNMKFCLNFKLRSQSYFYLNYFILVRVRIIRYKVLVTSQISSHLTSNQKS